MVITDLHHIPLPKDAALGCRRPQKHQGYCTGPFLNVCWDTLNVFEHMLAHVINMTSILCSNEQCTNYLTPQVYSSRHCMWYQ